MPASIPLGGPTGALNECIFCRIVRGRMRAAVVSETPDLLAIMDLYPATPGHLLVLPKDHIEDIHSMPEDLGARLMARTIALAKAVRRALSPAGINLIQANGAAAGQTVPHFHLHLVPRYPGDDVELRFGHGVAAAELPELEAVASKIRDLVR